MKYQPIIGLEVHIELKTNSKMFCSCSADCFGAKPNIHTCPVCLGLPGSLPVPNKKAIEYCVLTGMALGCQVPKFAKFDRKNYFYPDLSKGYQISQYDQPFVVKGQLKLKIKNDPFDKTQGHPEQSRTDEKLKTIRINRVHLEEDTGKLIHTTVKGEKCTLIDFNRSGIPLMEIVTEPDLRSVKEVSLFARKLRQVIRYLGVSEADMEKGQMRFEANISVRERGKGKGERGKLPGYKVEVKNINSIKFLEKAVSFEIERQKKLFEKGKRPVQETRGWDDKKQRTVSQRKKEESFDYRYFPEPDIPPIVWTKKDLEEIRARVLELPDEKKTRFKKWFDLGNYEAEVLTGNKFLADWFEEALKAYVQTVWPGTDISKGKPKAPVAVSAFARPMAQWVMGELLRRTKEEGLKLEEIGLSPVRLAELLYLLDKNKISFSQAKEVLGEMFKTDEKPSKIIEEKGLSLIADEKDIKKVIDQILEKNKKAASDFRKGKKSALGFLIGQVMRATQGKAEPKLTREILLRELETKRKT